MTGDRGEGRVGRSSLAANCSHLYLNTNANCKDFCIIIATHGGIVTVAAVGIIMLKLEVTAKV